MKKKNLLIMLFNNGRYLIFCNLNCKDCKYKYEGLCLYNKADINDIEILFEKNNITKGG